MEIATNSDVILVAGPHKRRIQVCSFVLKNASKYFSNMFGPNFSEGQGLRVNRLKEILMPEDDANALEIICNILHLRNDVVPEALTPIEVLEIAVLADKFDCIVAVKHASTFWLNPRECQGITELGHLMAAAYILDNARAFSEITLSMILYYKDRYLSLAEEDIGLDDSVLWRVIYLLEERRSRMRTELQDILLYGTKDAGIDDDRNCSCGWSSRHSSAYMQLLQKEELWPLKTLDTTISQVLQKLECMDDPAMPREWVPCKYRWHTDPTYRISRSQRLENFKRSNGLCIDCVRSSTTTMKHICQIKHGSHEAGSFDVSTLFATVSD
ncbi:hypothetical protein PSPO01_15627 [Paraphaeosphaeria sporulosa]